MKAGYVSVSLTNDTRASLRSELMNCNTGERGRSKRRDRRSWDRVAWEEGKK